MACQGYKENHWLLGNSINKKCIVILQRGSKIQHLPLFCSKPIPLLGLYAMPHISQNMKNKMHCFLVFLFKNPNTSLLPNPPNSTFKGDLSQSSKNPFILEAKPQGLKLMGDGVHGLSSKIKSDHNEYKSSQRTK